ncbi:MAG TPA: protein kinase [Pirellulales bacterium]|nr:protein kinase [Pirellulales bacterium]
MPASTTAEFQGTNRFEVIRRIGAGGMGVVYQALDRERDTHVALKFLPKADPSGLLRFKQEFRTLADVTHPNLAALFELFVDRDQWFFTMELVDGVDFFSYVRHAPPAPRPVGATDVRLPTTCEATPNIIEGDTCDDRTLGDEEQAGQRVRSGLTEWQVNRLRSALRQLVDGLQRLHGAGILHRDIKPSNVLVTPEGRVVLLDFGLAAELQPRHGEPVGGSDFAGTVAYMSPEQVEGRPLTPASDWYNVGTMLYEVLTGWHPFLGSKPQVMRAKKQGDPPDPKSLLPGTPADLNRLCMDLLCRVPEARPDAQTILRHGLAAGPTPAATTPADRARPTSVSQFIGRRQPLNELARAYAGLRDGRSLLVLIQGESGVGKSALVHRFLDELPRDAQPVILSGRCYEQESVPFKAFDGLIDALTHYLDSLPKLDAAGLLPRDVLALARIFPVVERVLAQGQTSARRAEVPDQRELRRRAFAALRELLARVGERRPLVLVIDDLQWGDVDSANLLNELLQPPDPPLLLLIATYRSEDVHRSACLQRLVQTAGAGEHAVSRTFVSLSPLTREECIDLALRLLERDDRAAVALAEEIAPESQGNPYLVCELAQHVRDGIRQAPQSEIADSAARVRLDDALRQRIDRLPPDERAVLEILSVAGRPLRPSDAFAAAAIHEPLSVLARLRTDRFIRVTGGGDELLAPYHDCIRETVVASLSPKSLEDRHRTLATVLQAGQEPDPRILAIHFEGAGQAEVAGRYYATAADEAATALAFDHAAELYRKSLELKPATGAERCGMLRKLAEALANAGRGAEAARQFLAAAADAAPHEALALRGQAGYQFCVAGDIDAGREALTGVLQRLGIRLPRSRSRALGSLLLNRCRLRLRGIRYRERSEKELPAAPRTRVDVTWSVAVGLTMIDTIRGADFQTRNLLLALRTGEPYRIARSLAWEATHVAMGGVAGRTRAGRMLDAAGKLAERLGHPHAAGMTVLGRGVSAFFFGDWREAHEVCDRAATVFTERCTGVTWELDTSRTFAYWSLFWLGRFGEIQDRFPRLVSDARQRGDRLAAANLTTFGGPFIFLSQDDPEAAAEAVSGVMGAWSQQDFHVQHFTTLSAHTYIDLYRGRPSAAWRNLIRKWPSLKASYLLEVECVRIFMRHLRAICALAAADDPRTASADRAALVREAIRDARRLDRERPRYCRPLAMTIRATLAARAGQAAKAADLLATAVSLLENDGLGMYAAAARFRRGRLMGGETGDELMGQASAWMRQEKIARPERIAALFAPSLDNRL